MTARRLLALEGASSADDGGTTAASRVYDKLHRRLAPLVGELGVELLFVRSVKLARGELAAALDDVDLFEGAAPLRRPTSGGSARRCRRTRPPCT